MVERVAVRVATISKPHDWAQLRKSRMRAKASMHDSGGVGLPRMVLKGRDVVRW